MRFLLVVLTSAAIGAAGVQVGLDRGQTVPVSPAPPSRTGLDAVSVAAMDPGVNACDDFCRHACGGFIAANKPTPETPSISTTGRAFDANLERGLSSLFARPIPEDHELDRLKTFYRSCLDGEVDSDRTIVKQWLDRIDTARSLPDIERLLPALSMIGVEPFFTYSGQPDRAHWSRYRGEIDGAYLWGGAIFAHEFIHVAESHIFGADGQDAELWSAGDLKSAKARDQCVIAQADASAPLPGVKMSGADQFDENVADYGGVRLAFAALQAWLGARIYTADASGTSPAQRFFYKCVELLRRADRCESA